MPRKWSHPGRQHSSQCLQVVLACLDELHEQPRRTAMPGLSFFVQNIEQGVHQLQLSVGHIALLDAAEMTSSSIRNSTTAISGKGYPCSMNCTKVISAVRCHMTTRQAGRPSCLGHSAWKVHALDPRPSVILATPHGWPLLACMYFGQEAAYIPHHGEACWIMFS